MKTNNTLDNDGYLRLPDVLKLIPVSKSTFWEGIKTGRYPKPVKLSERITAWRVSDIQKFLNSVAVSNQ